MIIDTTYLLPLVRIDVKTDLLKALVEGRLKVELDLGDLRVNLISIFELQAKASKLRIPPRYVSEAINTIFKVFDIIPYYREDIIEIAYELLQKYINDYIDCIILATAITQKEQLVTEDRKLLSIKDMIKEQYNIEILSYSDLVK